MMSDGYVYRVVDAQGKVRGGPNRRTSIWLSKRAATGFITRSQAKDKGWRVQKSPLVWEEL
jgi:hypothetical protein